MGSIEITAAGLRKTKGSATLEINTTNFQNLRPSSFSSACRDIRLRSLPLPFN